MKEEEEIRNLMKQGVKSPSPDFTDNLMKEISLLEDELVRSYSRKTIFLLIASVVVVVLSIFVVLPEIQLLEYSITIPTVVMPILSLGFLFVIFRSIYESRISLIEFRNTKKEIIGMI
jgi:hypothetical protein